MARQPQWKFAIVFALALSLSACSHTPTDKDPVGALRLFLDAMDRSRSDPSARSDAFALLSEESRDDLTRRARLATALAGGRTLQAHELLVPGRFRLRFTPRPGDGFNAHITGENATVLVRGRGEDEEAEVHMRLEDGRWRVSLDFDASDVPQQHSAPPAPAVSGAPAAAGDAPTSP